MNRNAVLARMLAVTTASVATVSGAAEDRTSLQWVRLGTRGGPIPGGVRSEPANLLVVGGMPWIVGCGDGAMDRLAAAGFTRCRAHVAFVSHPHVNHIGGLSVLNGLHGFTGAGSAQLPFGHLARASRRRRQVAQIDQRGTRSLQGRSRRGPGSRQVPGAVGGRARMASTSRRVTMLAMGAVAEPAG
jgi:glyoxylase-like metal-dependent hydrolase (beta-lactamase superfamily II)